VLFVFSVPFPKRVWWAGIGADRRQFYNVTHARAPRCIDKRIGHCHLVWHERWEQENFFDALQCIGEGCDVFKIKCRQRDVGTKLFSCFGLIAHAGADRRTLFGK
jgi:hypothetical protein